MSHITSTQILQGETAFHAAFQLEEERVYVPIAPVSPENLPSMIEYIAYLAYRARKFKRKYQNKDCTIFTYMNIYRKASITLTALIHAVGIESIHAAKPFLSLAINKFIDMDNLL